MSKKKEEPAYTPPASPEAEESVLGSILIRPEGLEEVIDILEPADFYREAHGRIYMAMLGLYNAEQPVDLVSVTLRLKEVGMLESVGGPVFLAALSEQVGFASNILYYAKVVKEKALLRRMLDTTQEIAGACFQPVNDVPGFLDTAEEKVLAVRESQKDRVEALSLKEILPAEVQRIEGIFERKVEVIGVPSGFKDLDAITGGWQMSDLILLAARPSMGKDQPLNAKILMKNGTWKSMSEIAQFDDLASIDGKESKVTGVFPQGKRPVYGVLMTDGRMVEAGADHLWKIHSSRFKGDRTVTTMELARLMQTVRHRNRTRLISHDGSFGEIKDIGMSPWLLGVLLSDGCLTKGSAFSNPEPYIQERIKKETGMEIHSRDGKDCRIFNARGVPNPLTECLKKLGIIGKRSWEKEIPKIVFCGTRHIREGVLSGLLEGDGWIEKSGTVCFSSASKELTEGVVRLVQSLGGTAKSWTKENTKYLYRGELRQGRTAYLTAIALDDLDKIIKSPRLYKNYKKRERTTSPIISEVFYLRDDLTQCITVSHPSKTYITDGYVVTHNTALALNMASYAAETVGVPTLFFSLEQPKEQLAQRLLAARGSINATRLRTAKMVPEDWVRLMEACGELMDKGLFIVDKPALTTLEIRATAKRWVKRAGIGLIVLDYLQLARAKGTRSREQEVGEVSRSLKALAKELKLPVIALAQLNRDVEKRPNKRPVLSDLRESGSMEMDADLVMFIYRDEVYKEDSKDKGTAEVRVAKQRNGPTGKAKLAFLKEYQRFEDLAKQEEFSY